MNINKKRKDKNFLEKDSQDDVKEIKNSIVEAKMLFEKANSPSDVEEALMVINSAIIKATGSLQMPHMNQLYHMRGLCFFKLKQYELAEKDYQ